MDGDQGDAEPSGLILAVIGGVPLPGGMVMLAIVRRALLRRAELSGAF